MTSTRRRPVRAVRFAAALAFAATLATSALFVTPRPAAAATWTQLQITTDRSIGYSMMLAIWPSGTQWYCLKYLWKVESAWEWWARNPYSGAYGIPQAYPAWRLATAGSDWRTNPRTQIKWGLSYIRWRYGTPCGAWNHELRYHWY